MWYPYYKNQIARIERIQRDITRYILKSPRPPHPLHIPYESRLSALQLESLESRRDMLTERMIRYFMRFAPSSIPLLPNTRACGSTTFIVPHARTNALRYSFFHRAARLVQIILLFPMYIYLYRYYVCVCFARMFSIPFMFIPQLYVFYSVYVCSSVLRMYIHLLFCRAQSLIGIASIPYLLCTLSSATKPINIK